MSKSKFGIFKSSNSHTPSSFEAIPNSPNSNLPGPSSSYDGHSHQPSSSQNHVLDKIERRLNDLEGSIANIAADVSELKSIKSDVETILKILQTSPPPNAIVNDNKVVEPPKSVTPPPPPVVKKPLGPVPKVNILLDIGTSGPEIVEIELRDEEFPQLCKAFREYFAGLMNEAKGGFGSEEHQVELLIWSKTYGYIDGWFMGDVDNLRPNFDDAYWHGKPYSVCVWGPKSGSTDPITQQATYSIEQMLMSDQPISQLIADGKLSGEWIIIGSVVRGQDALRSVFEKGVNKKGFLSFKSSN